MTVLFSNKREVYATLPYTHRRDKVLDTVEYIRPMPFDWFLARVSSDLFLLLEEEEKNIEYLPTSESRRAMVFRARSILIEEDTSLPNKSVIATKFKNQIIERH